MAVIGSHQATELTVSRGDRPNTPIVPNLVGSGYLFCLNYTARKSSRSSCAGEGVVIDQVLPGDFEIRLMVIVREGRNANEIVVIAADVMQNIKAQSWQKNIFVSISYLFFRLS